MNTSRPPSFRSDAAEPRHALRLLHLDEAIRRWLGVSDATGTPADESVGAKVSNWLRSAGDGPLFERLPALVAQLQSCLPTAQARSASDFDRAFAGALMHQAFNEVAYEAMRTGRADAFVCLKPYLQRNPDNEELAQLAQALASTPQAIELALRSLRRRLRGRVEAALELWSGTPDSRDTLRGHMRGAFTEPSP
jgi:hypothetical protein